MKKKHIILLAVAAAIIIVAAIVAISGSRNATFEQDYHIEDTASITKIFMADKQDVCVTLTRGADGRWVVDDTYEANAPMVDLLLETLNTMRIREQVNKNAIPNAIKDLAAHSIKVEVYQNTPWINWFGGRLQLFFRERLTTTYYVGRETRDMMGSFMFREGDKVPYVIHIPGFRGFLTPRFVTEPLKWRSHTIVDLNVRAIARVELDIPQSPAESFAIVRQGDGFGMELTHPVQPVVGFDTARVARMLSSFTWLNFDEFASIVPNSFADSCVSGVPRTILRITDTAGVTREVKTFIKYINPDDLITIPDPDTYETFDLDRLYAIISGGSSKGPDTVLIQYYVFDNILQPASYFRGADKTTLAK
ncbi:MAG: DUF4340 domain-containing protein [Bacteroidales bacterium]|nr:DUF4340 domain-containing protein [Bacteroidales bacterium]